MWKKNGKGPGSGFFNGEAESSGPHFGHASFWPTDEVVTLEDEMIGYY